MAIKAVLRCFLADMPSFIINLKETILCEGSLKKWVANSI